MIVLRFTTRRHHKSFHCSLLQALELRRRTSLAPLPPLKTASESNRPVASPNTALSRAPCPLREMQAKQMPGLLQLPLARARLAPGQRIEPTKACANWTHSQGKGRRSLSQESSGCGPGTMRERMTEQGKGRERAGAEGGQRWCQMRRPNCFGGDGLS